MTTDSVLVRWSQSERLNFLLTNRIPRRWATLFMGWFSRIRNPWVRGASIAIWRYFADDLALHEARKTEFDSLHDCFIRQLKPGARPIDPDPSVLVSPCDGIVGACGEIAGTEVFQAKGFPYSMTDLLADASLVERYRDGIFVTLRLKSSMYHRFHAPEDARLSGVTYISGDTWNVNPVALKRVERLFCRNERAVLTLGLGNTGQTITLVPVAAILVAGIRLHCLAETLDLRYRGPNHLPCDARFERGEEMGYFQHGSTIIVFAPRGFALAHGIRDGHRIRVGEPLLRKP
ncbi:MAG: archaetidylserine decarboxylase [Gammaproteobacteria bacterium]